jgi:hypothetical protein
MRTRQSLPIRLPYEFATSITVGFTPNNAAVKLMIAQGAQLQGNRDQLIRQVNSILARDTAQPLTTTVLQRRNPLILQQISRHETKANSGADRPKHLENRHFMDSTCGPVRFCNTVVLQRWRMSPCSQ